jgi:hypothetical protein
MTPFEWFTSLLDAVGSQPFGKTPRQCPAHRDAAPSLSVHEREGSLMIRCHAGCGWRQILTALGCSGSIFREAPPWTAERHLAEWSARGGRPPSFPDLETGGAGHPGARGYRLEVVHHYRNGAGHWFLERWRHPVTRTKDLRWFTETDQGRIPGLLGLGMHELPLYNEIEVRAALVMGEPVVLVESESSADALKGWAATTWAGGAASVPVRRILEVLGDGSGVVCVPDVDEAGLRCAEGLRATLPNMGLVAGLIGEDAKDLYQRIGCEVFAARIKEATVWQRT